MYLVNIAILYRQAFFALTLTTEGAPDDMAILGCLILAHPEALKIEVSYDFLEKAAA